MKRFLSIFLAIFALTFAACTSSEEENGNNSQGGNTQPIRTELTVSSTSLLFDAKDDIQAIDLYSTDTWTAEFVNDRASEWCSIAPQNGQAGDSSIIVSVTENNSGEERSASIIIKAKSLQKVVKVTQKQMDALTVTSSVFEVEAEGGEVEIEVKANVDFDYIIDPEAEDWVTFKTTRAMESSTLVFDIAENPVNKKREAKITFKSGNIKEVVTIYQEGTEYAIILSKNEYTVSDKGETIAVEVKSNVDVAVEIPSDVDWVKENSTRAMSTNTYYFEVSPNEDYNSRSTVIKFTNKENNLSETVTITQVQKDAIVLAKNSYTIDNEGGEIDIEVGHNVDFDVEISDNWITKTSTRAFETETLTFNIAANNSDDGREGTIKFISKDKAITQIVKVFQSQSNALIVSKKDIVIDEKEQTVEFEVRANVEYTVSSSSASWLHREDTRAMTSQTIRYRVDANSSYDSRTATITVQSKDGSLKETITVTQAQKDAIVLAKNSYTVDNDGGEIDIEVGHNVDFDVEISHDWITKTTTRAFETETLTFNIAANNSDDSREGTIKFISKDKTITQTVKVVQAAATPKPKNNEIWYTSTDGNVVTPYKTDVFGANIVYNIYENGKGVITFDKSVTTIGESAFYGCSSLKRITIPDSVTEIGDEAFQVCSRLATVNIPDSVTKIGDFAFAGCSSLRSFTIGDSVTTIGYSAFYYSSLTDITIPDSVTTIGERAFYKCYSLEAFYGKFASADNKALIVNGTLNAFAIRCGATSYIIPDSVTMIGDWAFGSCNLNSVTIPDSVTKIGDFAFAGCSSLRSVTIGNSVTTIGDEAFDSCSRLTNVTIGNSVTTIGELAFYNCSSLKSVTIPDSVTTIGEAAFWACSSLTNVTISNSVTYIVEGAFSDCSSLTNVTIPDSVTKIGGSAFARCSSLTNVTIPENVTTIGNYAFEDCSSLKSVTIGNSVTTIGNGAFSDCSSLTTITIPDSMTEIGGIAFNGCSSLKSVYCRPQIPPTAEVDDFFEPWMAFMNNASGRKIYVPKNSVAAYKAAYGWDYYADAIVGYDF